MVSSNRAQRKGTAPTTSRRDPTDEPQAGNKPNKSISTNAGKRIVSLVLNAMSKRDAHPAL